MSNQGETTTMPTGTVKWFNATKGFGFIAPDDGATDVFVHISALERSGLRTLGDGERVCFEPRPGRDGRVSAEDVSLLAPTDDAHQGAPSAQETDVGTVKWFNATKGYGFIEPEDGSKDVFVHAKAVERTGLGTLQEGQRVRYELRAGRKGKLSAENLAAE